MSGKINKRLRREARKRAGSYSGLIVAKNPETGDAKIIDLYKQYKKMHGRLPWNLKKKALESLGR